MRGAYARRGRAASAWHACGASALTWGEALEIHNYGKGTLTCVDAWEPYYDPNEIPDEISREINSALDGDEPYEVFQQNMRHLPSNIKLTVHRGWSSNVLPDLYPSKFEFAYIDGDHSYQSVLNDLEHCCGLLREGGIICGDDLELQVHKVDASIAAKRPKLDKLYDETHNITYHPGVTLAVGEMFGPVTSWHGFWAMQKIGPEWQSVSLEGMPFHIPSYITPKNLVGLKALLMDYGLM